MAEDTSIDRLHERIDEVLTKSGVMAEKLNALHTDVKVIKEAGRRRDVACITHNRRTDELDVSMRGNGKDGVLVRLRAVEQSGSGKEKFAFLVIGAFVSGIFALGIALLIRLAA